MKATDIENDNDEPMQYGMRSWVFASLVTAIVCVLVITILITVFLVIRPNVAPLQQGNSDNRVPVGLRGFQNVGTGGGGLLGTSQVIDINTFYSINIVSYNQDTSFLTGGILYYSQTIAGSDCSLSGYPSSCQNAIVVPSGTSPLYWAFEPYNIPGVPNTFIMMSSDNTIESVPFVLTISQTSGGDCFASGYSLNCSNAILLPRSVWSSSISLQNYWQLIPVNTLNQNTGGIPALSQNYIIRMVAFNGMQTDQYLYASSGGQDAIIAGYSTGYNVFTIGESDFLKNPIYWYINGI